MIRLMEMAGERPGAQAAPVMHHRHPNGQRRGRAAFVQRLYAAEVPGHVRYDVVEFILAYGEVQVATQTYALYRLPGQRPAHVQPVAERVLFRLAALRKCGQPAQPHGEQVRMETQFMGLNFGKRAQAALEAGEHALYEPVEAYGREILAAGLHAHPAVVVKHVGLFAVGMDDVHQRPGFFRHETLDEVHIVLLRPGRRAVGSLKQAFVYEILGGQGVAVFLLKRLERGGAHGKVVAGPVHETAAEAHVVPEYPHEIVEQRSQAHHIRLGIGFAPVFEPLLQVLPGQGMPGIQLAQMLAGPVVGGVVVHIDLFPHPPRQEGHRIPVEGFAVVDLYCAAGVFPLVGAQQAVARPVPHLPVLHGFGGIVQFELLCKIPFQGPYLQRLTNRDQGL